MTGYSPGVLELFLYGLQAKISYLKGWHKQANTKKEYAAETTWAASLKYLLLVLYSNSSLSPNPPSISLWLSIIVTAQGPQGTELGRPQWLEGSLPLNQGLSSAAFWEPI